MDPNTTFLLIVTTGLVFSCFVAEAAYNCWANYRKAKVLDELTKGLPDEKDSQPDRVQDR